MGKFLLHWQDGKTECIKGNTISEAFTRAGYGNGALKALDYYTRLTIRDEIKLKLTGNAGFYTEDMIVDIMSDRNPDHVRNVIRKMRNRKELTVNPDFTVSINYDWKPNSNRSEPVDQSAADDYLDYLDSRY